MGADLGSASAEILVNTAKATANIKNLESSLRGLSGTQIGAPNSSGFVNSLGAAKAQTQSLGDTIITMGPQLTAVGGVMAGFGAVVLGAFGFGVKAGVDFESQMAAVGSVTGATGKDLSALREEAIRLGADTTFSATESAQAMEILAKAGVSTGDIMAGATEDVLNLAAATGTDVPLSAETAAASMNVFGVSSKDAADIISRSANVSSLDVNDWALAIKSAGPIAASTGMSMGDLANAMIILGDAGIKGEVAATALRNIITNLADSTSEGSTALAEYGVATTDAAGNFRGLEAITHDLAGTWGDLTQAQKIQLAQQVAGKDGAAAFMTMMDAQTEAVKNNGDAFDNAAKRMAGVGTAQEQAAQRMDSL
ncbi:MAG: phage tail tape measure protein, partial [Thermomicrobiales bacterium]